MIVSMKDGFKLAGIVIVCFCAVFVCALFLNYRMDLQTVEGQITGQAGLAYYDAQQMTCKVICLVTGGCLLLTSVVLLVFYIRQYIENHKRELGILKAMGYSNGRIAVSFGVFGLGVFAGALAGYGLAHCFMPLMYRTQNDMGYLPDFSVRFHPLLFVLLVFLPALLFAALSVGYSYLRQRTPVMDLLQNAADSRVKTGAEREARSFLAELEKSNLRQRKSLVFFITFASFCFSAMVQMSVSMKDLSSVLMGAIMFAVGMLLAIVTLFLALASVRRASAGTITMMKVFGYGRRECSRAVLGGYRPWSYLGFALGTVYQYGLLKLMVSVVFADVEEVPDYAFDVPVCLLTLLAFAVLYELLMLIYGKRMDKLSIREIMSE